MIQQTSPQAAERRRANFASGLRLNAGDHANSHDSSYQHLRAELGEENTNRLITNIGTLAMSSGIAASGVSLSDAVKRIIGSLTPGERSAIASGGAPPPRVQALLDSEVKAAQQQRQTQLAAATATTEDGLPGNRNGLIPTAFAAMDREMRGRTTRSSEYSDLRSDSISSANYNGSAYARTGLNYATFSDLRNQGFNGSQIMAAANTTRALGIDTNRNAAPMARVQRDIPSAVPGLHTTHDNWTAVRNLEAEQKRAQEAGNAAAAEALSRSITEARKRAEEHDTREHERVKRERPERAGDHQHLQSETRRSALGHEAAPAVRNDARVSDATAVVTRPQSREADTVAVQATQVAARTTEQDRASRVAAGNDMFGPPAAPSTQQAAAKPAPAQSAPQQQAEATPQRPAAQPPRMASPTVRA